MADLSYKGLFHGWEVAIAKSLVNEFKIKWRCLDIDGFKDLLQECLLHWLFVKDKYDSSSEASPRTFMFRVVRNKLNDIVKGHDRLCRRISQNIDSLDEPLFEEDDSPTLFDRIKEDESRASDPRDQTELRIDLSQVCQHLTPKQKKLCELLGEHGLSVHRASEILKIPRSSIREEIKRIKAIFIENKLHEYLD